jgi:hypothetical protein
MPAQYFMQIVGADVEFGFFCLPDSPSDYIWQQLNIFTGCRVVWYIPLNEAKQVMDYPNSPSLR